MQQLRKHGDEQLAAHRWTASQAARPQFAGLTPAQQATELVARLEVAKQHKDRAMWDAARAELALLIEQM